jgi:hypothetical protein
MILRATVTLVMPSAVTTLASAPTWYARTHCNCPATRWGRRRALGKELRSPRRSVIPILSAMRFTMPAWLTNSAASVRLPSRPRNAPRTWPRNIALSPWRASSLVVKGWATAVGGVEEAAQLIDREIDKATAAGPVPQYYLGLAAEVLLAAGRPADGLAHLDRAIATVDEPGVGFYLPEIYRLRGECLLALGRDRKEEARQSFATARDVARQQGAVIFERRAEASLAEVANSRGV